MSGLNFTTRRIGIVGAGGIVRVRHLPAYRTEVDPKRWTKKQEN